jgi:peroxiredoxin Q/BCP
MSMPEKGSPAPKFTTVDQSGQGVSLEDFLGTRVVLYFYPKDDTPGCTIEACEFRDEYALLKKSGYEILGVSVDNQDSHRSFAEKYQLPFRLLVDEDKKIVTAYGVWAEKNVLGTVKMGTRRVTFVIDEKGLIARVFPNVKPEGHASEILAL